MGSWMWIEGRPMRSGEATDVEYRRATAGYFSTMGIPLRSGRYFEDRDDAPNAPQVVMINEAVARKLFPNQDPVGRRIKLGANPDTQPWITIVGVVGNVRHFAVEVEPRPEVYQPVGTNALFSPIMVVRTTGDPRALLPAINAAVAGANCKTPGAGRTREGATVAALEPAREFFGIFQQSRFEVVPCFEDERVERLHDLPRFQTLRIMYGIC